MAQTAHEQYYDQDRAWGTSDDEDDPTDPNDTGPECMCENSTCPFHPADQYCLNPQDNTLWVSFLGATCCTQCATHMRSLGYDF